MTARTIYALTAGHKPVVVTNHFYMRPDIRDSPSLLINPSHSNALTR